MNTNIEVTEKTFYKIFSIKDFKKVEKKENYVKEYFGNVNQYGVKIWNYASSKVWQYYFFDINA